MKLSIRSALPDDADAMAAIERECFSDPWSEESFRQMMALPVSLSLAATTETDEGEGLVGYLMALAVEPEGEIANIAVSPNCRRLGVGRALMTEGLRLMEERGCDRFFLEVRESNLPAQALYGQLGFEVTGRRKRYYKDPCEDALLMARLPAQDDPVKGRQ